MPTPEQDAWTEDLFGIKLKDFQPDHVSQGKEGPSPSVQSAPPAETPIMETAHTVLSGAGFIPEAGAIANLANAALYAVEGNYKEAGISAAMAAGDLIPEGGQVLGGVIKGGEKIAEHEAIETAKTVAEKDFTKTEVESAEKEAERARRLPPEKLQKVLTGQRVPNPGSPNGISNEVIGGHSPGIKSMRDYDVQELAKNADGTSEVKFIKQFPDGSLSKIKKSTLAPDNWTDKMIEDATHTVADTPAVATRASDDATLHRETIDGVQWEVICDRHGVVTASYPTGGTPIDKF